MKIEVEVTKIDGGWKITATHERGKVVEGYCYALRQIPQRVKELVSRLLATYEA